MLLNHSAGVALAATFAASLWAAPVMAQTPKTVAEIANYKGADRQKMLEDGAKKEGQLQLYAIGTQNDPVYKAFNAKYPYIKIEVKKNDTAVMTRLIMEEASANTYNVDAIELTTGGLHPMRQAGLLQPYWSPEMAAYEKDAIEPGRHWVLDYESYLSLGYNTDLVSEADAPKTYDDLLNPKWKGKMALPGTSTLANWIGAVLKEKDESFLRKLGQQDIRIYEVSARAIANLVISGEVALSPSIYNSHVANSRKHGGHIAWRALGGVYPTTDGAVIAAHAPHPHAAMLFIDFVLSKDGQKVFQNLGYSSAREDMRNPDKPAKIYYLTDDPNYLQNYEKWMTLGHQIFGGGKKK
jgi:iron(III) transport system substrate-binding protein